ncbi:conserved hypothetical protein [Tenacibaculum dicentrarchi]|nr:conserved hypothetical protein [Tenacibaculum dicentrarchi]
MPDLYIPSDKVFEKVRSLVQGFWLEIDDEGIIVLLMKFEASILTSLIAGSKIEIVVRNPKLENRSSTLYLYDRQKDPLWITWQKFGKEHKEYIGFDEVLIKLIQSSKIRVAYFNTHSEPIFTTVLEKKNTFNSFKEWVINIYSSTELLEKVDDGYYAPETENKGYTVSIDNRDSSSEEKMTIFNPLKDIEWSGDFNESGYNFNDYLKDGKHGYNQEISIKGNLINYFTANEELYHSPKKTDGTELIDFLVHYKKATILIESKFILSEKQSKLNQAFSKAVKQLKDAEEIIKTDLTKIENEHGIIEKLANNEVIIRLCLYNDSKTVNSKNLKNIIKKYSKNDLPVFISCTNFFQLLGDIKLKNEELYKYNTIQNLIFLYNDFLDDNERDILIIKEYTMKFRGKTA